LNNFQDWEIFYTLKEAKTLIEKWRKQYQKIIFNCLQESKYQRFSFPRFEAHLHLSFRRSRSFGINDESHCRVDVGQDAGAVFPYAQLDEARRDEQASK